MRNNSLANIYTDTFQKNWKEAAFTDYEGLTLTYSEVAIRIRSLHLFYQIAGLQKGDKVVVLGRNTAHWGATFLSVISAGLVIVPVLPDFNPVDVNHIIHHSEAKLVFSSGNLLNKVDINACPGLKALVRIEDFTVKASADENMPYKLEDAFAYYRENKLSRKSFQFEELDTEDLCIISYTSGTSGFTKGVMIPERSLVSNLLFARENMPLKTGNKIVSFLPLAHVYGLLFEFLFPLSLGCHITFLSKMPTPAILTKVFGEIRPHLILSVPLIIEKIYKKRLAPVLNKPLMKILLAIPLLSSVMHGKIKKKLTDIFGGRFFEIVIGGAPLNAEVEQFFRKIKFPFTIGYGMTECGPLISYAAWNKTKSHSAGKIVDRMEVRIDSENPMKIPGEIQVKGDNTMLGYFKSEADTEAVFTDDGWLQTGDLGIIDQENFVFIKGRSKNMILGPSGQNIYPEEIESRLCALEGIAESVVVEREGKLVALVYPDHDRLKELMLSTDALPGLMEKNRKKVNSQLPGYEHITQIELVEEEFEKTPKKNIRRFKYL